MFTLFYFELGGIKKYELWYLFHFVGLSLATDLFDDKGVCV